VDQGTAISKEREQSRVGFQFPSNLDPLAQIEETIGFSRMESQSRPNLDPLPADRRDHWLQPHGVSIST